MKSLILILLFFNITTFSFSQNTIIASYNSVHVGRNITLGIEKKIKRHGVYVAAKYHVNRRITDDQNNFYKKRFYAIGVPEHFYGVELCYRYDLKKNTAIFYPFYFLNLQITHSHTRNRMLLPYTYDTLTGDVLYKEYLEFFGPFTAFELNTGAGHEIAITNKLSIYQKLGVGIVFITGKEKRLPATLFQPFQWEFSAIISFGIGYKIGKRE